MLERPTGPLIPQQRLLIELHQHAPGIEPATGREFPQRHRRPDLPGVAVDENAEALLERFGHRLFLAAKEYRGKGLPNFKEITEFSN